MVTVVTCSEWLPTATAAGQSALLYHRGLSRVPVGGSRTSALQPHAKAQLPYTGTVQAFGLVGGTPPGVLVQSRLSE